VNRVKAVSYKPKIVFFIDRFDWAFDRIAKAVTRHIGGEFEIVRVPYPDYIRERYKEHVDVAVYMWWKSAKTLMDNVSAGAHIIAIYDAFSWPNSTDALKEISRRIEGVVVANPLLKKQISAVLPKTRFWLCEDGVDTGFFSEQPMPSGEFTIGWAGNSKAAGGIKGLHLIESACNIAGVDLLVADRNDAHVPWGMMPSKFYKEIHAYCCASTAEGTPNPVLEAMSCARPIISTNVGLVPQLVNKDNGIIVNRSVSDIANAIAKLKKANVAEMGKAARAAVEPFDWSLKAQDWKTALQECLP